MDFALRWASLFLLIALICILGIVSSDPDDDFEMLKNLPSYRIAPAVYDKDRQNFAPNYTLSETELRIIRSELLYPFADYSYPSSANGNNKNGDYQPAINNNSPQITKSLNFLLPFFGFAFNYTWVSINGFISFSDGPQLMNYPLKFPVDKYPNESDPSFIGPFYSKCIIGELNGDEIDARKSGVYYRLEQNLMAKTDEAGVKMRERIKWDIREGIVGAEWFEPRHAVIITWKNVTFAGGTVHARKTTNTFQLVLATDETKTYAMFNYQHLGWQTHTEAGGSPQDGTLGTPAFIGFNAGNGTRSFEYKPYSQGPKLQNIMSGGNVNGFPNRHIFRIDERIMSGQCISELYDVPSHLQLLTFAPESGNMLGGTIVNVTGPCFKPDQRIYCRFNTIRVQGHYVNENRASCIMPRIYITGYIDIYVEVEGSNDLLWKGKFFVETPEQAPELVSFNRNEILETEPNSITVKWDFKNLTMDQNSPVSISLWGYRETTINPEIIFIDSIVVGTPNNGYYTFNPREINDKKTPWAKNIQIGLVSVNLTNPSNPMSMPYQPVLWSRPIPLAWYMWPQWVESRGKWSEKMCENWIEQDRLLKNFAFDIPICPCMLEQAEADRGRFLPDQNCDQDGKVDNCYLHEGAKHCVRSSMPTQSGAGQQCCYDIHGYLMMTADQKWGGRPNRAHDFGTLPWNEANKVPSLSHYLHDVAPFFPCCMWQEDQSWWCMTYRFERRPSQNCVGYQPPGVATVFGDPHFYTFDGSQYTFNGKGEFVFVRANSDRHKLDVQGRFEQPTDNTYGEVKATILTAVAAKDNQSSTVEIRLRPKDAQWRYKLDVFVDQHRIFFDRFPQKVQTFSGVTVYTPTSIQNQSHVIAMFQSGAGVEVIENDGHLTARVYLPMTFLNQTRGLFGNWSGLIEDDYTLPDGSIGPQSNLNNLDAMHRQFGIYWSVDNIESETRGSSLFYHEGKSSSNSYASRNFLPEMRTDPYSILPLNVTIKADMIESFCGDSYQCKYDYSVSLDRNMAFWTKYYQAQFTKLRDSQLRTITSCGPLLTPIHGRKTTFKFTPGTEVQFDCDPEFVLVGERKRVCLESGNWNVPSSGGDDSRVETEWYNWNPTKVTRCIEAGEHEATASGVTIAIIFGILVPIAILLLCLIAYFRNRANDDQDEYNVRKSSTKRDGFTPLPLKNSPPKLKSSTELLSKPGKENSELSKTSNPKSYETSSTLPSKIELKTFKTNSPPKNEGKKELKRDRVSVDRPSPAPQVETLNSSPKSGVKRGNKNRNSKRLDSDSSSDGGKGGKNEPMRGRADPVGQSRSRKPISNFDAVYYTGEPLPNRPNVDFRSDDDGTSGSITTSRETSPYKNKKNFPPPPPPVVPPKDYEDGKAYVSSPLSV